MLRTLVTVLYMMLSMCCKVQGCACAAQNTCDCAVHDAVNAMQGTGLCASNHTSYAQNTNIQL